MYAAVVDSFDRPPRYREFPDPHATAEGEVVVDVLATGLHPLVRSRAAGTHYSSTDELPLVPGVDGVVRDASGTLRYAILDDTTLGTMAERTVIDVNRSIVLPSDADPILIAAAMNPAMSSWVALRRRISCAPGQSVLIVGATGNAGSLAVQVAKKLGASRVIAAGRNEAALSSLLERGADEVLPMDGLAAAADVDVVVDYVWGEPAAHAMVSMITARKNRSSQLDWIQIGSVAGATAPIPSAALRASGLRIVGSGMGSVPKRVWLEELPKLVDALVAGDFSLRAESMPLSQVEHAWQRARNGGARIVLVP